MFTFSGRSKKKQKCPCGKFGEPFNHEGTCAARDAHNLHLRATAAHRPQGPKPAPTAPAVPSVAEVSHRAETFTDGNEKRFVPGMPLDDAVSAVHNANEKTPYSEWVEMLSDARLGVLKAVARNSAAPDRILQTLASTSSGWSHHVGNGNNPGVLAKKNLAARKKT